MCTRLLPHAKLPPRCHHHQPVLMSQDQHQHVTWCFWCVVRNLLRLSCWHCLTFLTFHRSISTASLQAATTPTPYIQPTLCFLSLTFQLPFSWMISKLTLLWWEPWHASTVWQYFYSKYKPRVCWEIFLICPFVVVMLNYYFCRNVQFCEFDTTYLLWKSNL